jgi:threonylcarbamoyladenosine tRNA methylthiotransferase MtaB
MNEMVGDGRPAYRITTLGCRVNRADSLAIERELLSRGYREATSKESPSVWIINTCAVTAEGARKSRKAVRRGVASGAKVLVTGCASGLEDWDSEGVDLVFSNEDKKDIALACEVTGGEATLWSASGLVRVPLKVQDGCTRYCTYCIVPYLRGAPYSLGVEEVLADAAAIEEAGAGETVVCGIDLGSYRGRDGEDIVDLVSRLISRAGRMQFRLSSLELSDIDGMLLDLMAAPNELCRHLHLPLQSGDGRVLSDMGRGYTPDQYKDAVRWIRDTVGEVSVTTDVMVGFPTETESAFYATAAMLEELGFSRVHVFRYSPRPGTKAFELGDPVAPAEKERRASVLRGIAWDNAARFHARFVGRIIPVLVEAAMSSEPGHLFGRSEGFAGVVLKGDPQLIGRRLSVRVTSSDASVIRAEALEDAGTHSTER